MDARRALPAVALLVAALSFLLSAWVWVEGGQVGRAARETQCDREPVMRKIAQAAYAVRDALPSRTRIATTELARFMRQAPKDCPPP